MPLKLAVRDSLAGHSPGRRLPPQPAQPQHTTNGLRERGNDTSSSTGRQNAASQRKMRTEDRVTVQGPVEEQQPDGTSHRGCLPPFLMHHWGQQGATTVICNATTLHAPLSKPTSVWSGAILRLLWCCASVGLRAAPGAPSVVSVAHRKGLGGTCPHLSCHWPTNV